jgi:hypothetical protein
VRIEILDQAELDLLDGFYFYEGQQPGLGKYFLDNLYSDIELLLQFAGIHLKPYGTYHRLLFQAISFRDLLHPFERHGADSRRGGLPA